MLHGVLSPSQHGQTMVEKQTRSCLRIITGQWLSAQHFRRVVLGIVWPQARKDKFVHPRVKGSESKGNGNLFSCINMFHPLLATSGSEGWGFSLKGGATLVPLISLYECWGDQWDHVYEADWLECAHVVQCRSCQQDLFFLNFPFLFSELSQIIGNLNRLSHVLKFKSLCQHTLGNSFVVRV